MVATFFTGFFAVLTFLMTGLAAGAVVAAGVVAAGTAGLAGVWAAKLMVASASASGNDCGFHFLLSLSGV